MWFVDCSCTSLKVLYAFLQSSQLTFVLYYSTKYVRTVVPCMIPLKCMSLDQYWGWMVVNSTRQLLKHRNYPGLEQVLCKLGFTKFATRIKHGRCRRIQWPLVTVSQDSVTPRSLSPTPTGLSDTLTISVCTRQQSSWYCSALAAVVIVYSLPLIFSPPEPTV